MFGGFEDVYGWLGWVVSWSAGRICSAQRGMAMSGYGRDGVTVNQLLHEKKILSRLLEVFMLCVVTSVLAYQQNTNLHAS